VEQMAPVAATASSSALTTNVHQTPTHNTKGKI